jgi:chemotaxis protein CheC
MSVPSVDLVTREELIRSLKAMPDDDPSGRLVSIAQDFESGKDISTEAVLLFPHQASQEVVRRMLGDHAAEAANLSDLEQDALAEVGNIIINSCMGTMADLFKMEFQGSLPTVNCAPVEQLINRMHPNNATLLAHISMTLKASNVSGVVMFLMNVPSLEVLIAHMRLHFGLDDLPDNAN